MTSVEINSAIGQAAPPSIPYEPPVSQSGPELIARKSGAGASRSMPLTGRPSKDACAQVHDQCSPSGNHKLRVRKYATASQRPANSVLRTMKPRTVLEF